MSATHRIYNTTDGPLIVDAEGHVLASRESTRVPSLDDEPIAGHLVAGRLVDTTEAKADGADAEEQLAELVVDDDPKATKTKATKAANPTTRS